MNDNDTHEEIIRREFIHVYNEDLKFLKSNYQDENGEELMLRYSSYHSGYDIVSTANVTDKIGTFHDKNIDFNPYHNLLMVYQYASWKTRGELKQCRLRDTILHIDTGKLLRLETLQGIILFVKLEKVKIEPEANEHEANEHEANEMQNLNDVVDSSVFVENKYKYVIKYYINKHCLKNIFKKSSNTYYVTEVISKIRRQKINQDILESLNKILYNTDHESIKNDDVKGQLKSILKDNISLYEYQFQDILWMKKIEHDVEYGENRIEYNYSYLYMIDFTEYSQDLFECVIYNNVVLSKEIINQEALEMNANLYYYGGHLINSMGLGKTLIVLSYLFLKNNSIYDQYISYSEKCNYFYKRGHRQGLTCTLHVSNKNSDILNHQLFCTQHCDTLFIDKRNIEFKNLEYLNLKECIVDIDDKYYLKTNASIILCPNHLCDQWVREYYDKFKVKKRILLVVTYNQFKNLTVGDILFADIIVISFNFLLNQQYKSCRVNKLIESIYETETNVILSTNELCTFDNFYYNTIVIDEVHEIDEITKKGILKNNIHLLKSQYRWTMSGTPFALGVENYLTAMSHVTNIMYHYDDQNNMSMKVVPMIDQTQVLFRRNTKESIIEEKIFSLIKETCKLLEFTQQERNIYDSYARDQSNYDYLIKLCCHPEIDKNTRNLIENCKTFDEMQQVLLEHNKKKMDELEKNLKKWENDLEILDQELRTTIIEERKTEIKQSISTIKRNITNKTKELEAITKVYNYLLTVLQDLHEVEMCAICLDDICIHQMAITTCGHKFCWNCINTFMSTVNQYNPSCKCPKCNTFITVDQIYKYTHTSINKQDTSLLEYYIQQAKSTKIGNIIYYIKQLSKEDKCIVFSQWDEMLEKIAIILTKENIKIVYCSGTVYQKNRAIKQFKTSSDVNIILLSSKHSASGINLTEANKIILVEPVYGSKEHREDIESQSIGRSARLSQTKPIEVIRFIIKNTIEEEIYNESCISNNETHI